MNKTSIEKKLNLLEQRSRKRSCGDQHLKLRNYMKEIADILRQQNISDLSTRDMCVLAIDWDNIYDHFRVMSFVVELRKEFGSKFQEHDDTDEFRKKLISMLQARGASTRENTRMPSDMDRIVSGDDREVMNEFSRYLAYCMDNHPRLAIYKPLFEAER